MRGGRYIVVDSLMKIFLISLFFCLSAKAASLTISGISSGGAMAAQMGVIYSEHFSGVATVAGTFYYCAGDDFVTKMQASEKLGTFNSSLFKMRIDREHMFSFNPKAIFDLDPANPMYTAVSVCMKNPARAVMPVDAMAEFEKQNLINPLVSIRNQKILLYQGQNDSVVNPQMAEKLSEFYLQNGVSPQSLMQITRPGGHNFPTDKVGLNSCATEKTPYVSSCNFNLAEKILAHLTGIKELKRTEIKASTELLKVVSQDRSGLTRPRSLAPYGYLAASEKCLKNPDSCHLHVALHGCEMSDAYDATFDSRYVKAARAGYYQMRTKANSFQLSPLPYIEQKKNGMAGLKFAQASGYLDYVEANDLMVLFPQTDITELNYPLNPKGCWDWYGWTGADYATNRGVEPTWLMAWIQDIRKAPQSFIILVANANLR